MTLQLYRLTNTDVVVLQEEEAELREKIAMFVAIIGDERTMYNLMKKELREVKKKFATPPVDDAVIMQKLLSRSEKEGEPS